MKRSIFSRIFDTRYRFPHSIGEVFDVRHHWYRLKCFVQRSRLGWSDHDMMALDSKICEMLTGMIGRFAENYHGIPGNMCQCLKANDGLDNDACFDRHSDEWHAILLEMRDGFAGQRHIDWDCECVEIQVGVFKEPNLAGLVMTHADVDRHDAMWKKKKDTAFELLSKYHEALWD